MRREELLSRLQEALKTEESAVTIYAGHLSAIVTRSGLPDEAISHIKKTLDELIEENKKHKRELTSLIQQIEGESIDVY
jgi:rubrerythrin